MCSETWTELKLACGGGASNMCSDTCTDWNEVAEPCGTFSVMFWTVLTGWSDWNDVVFVTDATGICGGESNMLSETRIDENEAVTGSSNIRSDTRIDWNDAL